MKAPARWLVPEPAEESIAALGSALGLHAPATRVLWHRGYRDAESARRFLAPSLGDLHDPYLLRDMEQAVARLQRALADKEPILLYGDYDVDGTSSIVILKKALDLAGGNVSFHVPHRVRDGYGMRPEVIDRAAAQGVRLIVSVDTGIRAAAVVEHARTLGIDVIVTDHHLPEDKLPPALAVINPNRPDCGYPEKGLCGAGVAFKLVQALMARLGWTADRIARLTESFLKLVAIATVADVVPLTGENRVIVKRGLEGFGVVRNPGLRALLRVAGLADGACPSSTQIAFRVAPRINAAGRMASADDVIELFLTNDEARAEQIAGQLHELNKDRQDTEVDIIKAILEECSAVPVTSDQAALVFAGKGWHRGVVGIVASRLVDRFHRPAFVLSEDEETGLAQGSGRSIAAFHLLDALETMGGLFTKFGGHRQAAGLTLQSADIEQFRSRLNTYARSVLTEEDLQPTLQLDGELRFNELRDREVEEVLGLAPFGCGNPAPVFAILDAEVAGPPSVLKEKHLKVPLRQHGRTIMVTAWHFAERIAELQPGVRIDAAICLQVDDYSRSRGYGGWCAELNDVRPASAAANQYRNSAAI